MRVKNHVLLLGLLCSISTAALAQRSAAPAPLQIGRVIEGQMDAATSRHTLRLRAGQAVRITARGRDFDAFLKLYGPGGGDAVAEDDDSGGGTTAEITFVAERAGDYAVEVSESGGDGGADEPQHHAYDLAVLPSIPPAPPVTITPNPSQTVHVDMSQCGTRCRYTFQAKEGDRLVVQTTGGTDGADPTLELYFGSEKLAEDDDGGGDLDSRIIRRIDRTGTYTISAGSVGGRGQFDLGVSLRNTPPHAPLALKLGETMTGELTDESDLTDDGLPYTAYLLHGKAGQRYVVEMESEDFDAKLMAFADTLIGNSMIAMNDDFTAAPGLRTLPDQYDSRFVITFVRDGDVELRASSLDHQGAYKLTVTEGPAAAH